MWWSLRAPRSNHSSLCTEENDSCTPPLMSLVEYSSCQVLLNSWWKEVVVVRSTHPSTPLGSFSPQGKGEGREAVGGP